MIGWLAPEAERMGRQASGQAGKQTGRRCARVLPTVTDTLIKEHSGEKGQKQQLCIVT